MTDFMYSILNAGLSGIIGFAAGALYGMKTGKDAGKIEGWINANQEILNRAKARKDDLDKPFVYNSQILIIEDNDDARGILASALKMYGFRVYEAHNSYTGFQVVDQCLIHAAIIDLMLPDVDGYAIAKEIRKKNKSTRLIALTGHDPDPDKVAGESFDYHMTKPYQIDKIIRALS